MMAAAKALSLELIEVDVKARQEVEATIRRVREQGAEALYIWPGGLTFEFGSDLSELALANRLSSIHAFKESVQAGGLVSYGTDLTDVFRRRAVYVDKILRGVKPADLPVEQATKFELVINLKTARALGLKIAPSMLARADQVIE